MSDEDFKKLSDLQDVFCPFEALGAVRSELKHSNFLANLITPNGAHGFGDEMLRSFISAIFSETDRTELLLELHLSDLSSVIIMREWRHIDLLIRIPRTKIGKPDLVLAVEIKVEAAEHGNQLEEYEKAVMEAWPNSKTFFFFLTPDQVQSSREAWVDVSFSTIVNAIERSLLTGEGKPDARRMADLYVSMMRRRYVPNEQLNELAIQIWSRHRSALEFLIENQPNPANDLLEAIQNSDLIERINSHLQHNQQELRFSFDSSSARHLRLAVSKWDSMKGMLSSERWVASNRIFLLEIEVHSGGVHARWVVGPGPQDVRNSFIEAVDPGRTKKVSENWTRVGTKSILSKKEMEKLIEDGLNNKIIDKVIGDSIKYAVKTGSDFDLAFDRLGS